MSTMHPTKWKQVLIEEESNVAEAEAEVKRLEQLQKTLLKRVAAYRNLVEVLEANPIECEGSGVRTEAN